MERVFTLETRLQKKDIDYFQEFIAYYSKISRRVYQDFKHGYNILSSEYISNLRSDYTLLKRTANSIVRNIYGRIKALINLQKLQYNNNLQKIKSLESSIEELNNKILKLNKRINKDSNNKTLNIKYKNLKSRRWSLKNKLNKLKIRLNNYLKQDANTINICFGSKKLFKAQFHLKENGFKTHEAWLNAYRRSRDSFIRYLGSSDETSGNSLFQIKYNESTDDFSFKVRKEKQYESNGEYLTLDHINLKYKKDLLKSLLQYQPSLTYQILRRGRNKWYLQVSFSCDFPVKTTKDQGCLGIDFNNGFLAITETNHHGNLIKQFIQPLSYHGKGKRGKQELQETIKTLVKYSKYKGKSIVIEDLDFNKKKSKTISKESKQYNRMIHTLDYSRFTEVVTNTSIPYGVQLIKVNPAYTSIIGREKYATPMKLNTHIAASYVIARRGQGFKD